LIFPLKSVTCALYDHATKSMKPPAPPEPSDPSDQSHPSDPSDDLHRLLPKHGGYRNLRSFHAALAVYDATVIFCNRFIERSSRTRDQMVQAARSGARNISEGSVASGTSKKTELKLTNVARASLEELMGDYEDFLRQHALPIWDANSPPALATRRQLQSDQFDLCEFVRTAAPEAAANTLLCLINQASYLIHRQLDRLEQDFLKHGGFTERLYEVRSQLRQQQPESPGKTTSPPPACPLCAKPMRLRTTHKGPHAGQKFWGCSAYPECKGTRPV
jgi:restriction system protein